MQINDSRAIEPILTRPAYPRGTPEKEPGKEQSGDLFAFSDSVEISTEAKKAQETRKEEKKQTQELEKADTEVRQHEQAHKTAGGELAGAIQLEYATGPDGKKYAVAGHVQIDASEEETPEITLAKAQQISKAALAPKNPSSADRNIAAKAQRMAAEAQSEIVEETAESNTEQESSEQDQEASARQLFQDQATNERL